MSAAWPTPRRRACAWTALRTVALVAAASLAALPAGESSAGERTAACEAAGSGGLGGVTRQRLAALRRGFNLTGWLDRAPAERPPVSLLRELRQLSFTHVRLPVTAEHLMPRFAPPERIDAALRDIDAALRLLLDLGFSVSLDLHPGAAFPAWHRAQPEPAAVELARLWTLLAQRYGGIDPDRLLFEILNEPTVDAALWRRQADALVGTLKRVAPRHTVVVGLGDFQRHDALVAMAPLAHDNVVYAVHFYDPFVFTHQGMSWGADPARELAAVPFPGDAAHPRVAGQAADLEARGLAAAAGDLRRAYATPWTEARIRAQLATVGEWVARHRRPVIVNEFGVLKGKVNEPDRRRWLRAVAGASEAQCIGWAHWELVDGFGFVTLGRSQTMLDIDTVLALVGPR